MSEDLEGVAAADALLGRPVPLPAAALPLTRWSGVRAVGPSGVEVEWNLDASRAGAPGRLALYVGTGPPPERDWPDDGIARPVRVGVAEGGWREAPLSAAEAALRPAVELTWRADGLHLRLTAQGPWAPERLLEIAASVRPPG